MPLGRPRAFDYDSALDKALAVFWQKGYEGASLAELTAAMGINRPSLYAAYGDKATLFRRAVERYMARNACHVREALAAPTAREVVQRLWLASIDLIRSGSGPAGCLLVQSALACGDEAQVLRQELAERRADGEAQLRRRFLQAKKAGDLPAQANAGDLARYVATFNYGLAVQAAGGKTRAELRRAARLALRAFNTMARGRRAVR